MFTTRMRPHAGLALMAATALTLTACAGGGGSLASADRGDATHDATAAEGEPVEGGDLVVQIPTDPQALDVIASPGPATGYTVQSVFEKLFELDRDLVAQPHLVDDYTVSDDNLTYTFTLRDGVRFHDGDTLDAEDVVASLNRWLTSNTTGRAVSKSVAALEATDPLTVTLTLTAPRYGLVSELAYQGAEIYKAEVIEKVGDQGVRNLEDLIGTGPYKVVAWDRGQQIVTERFEDYTSRDEDQGGYAGARHQYLDSITFKVVGDQNAIVNGLQTGQWHFAMPDNNQFEVLEANPDLSTELLAGGYINAFVPNNHESSVFHDLAARHALNEAIDKPGIIAASSTGDLTIPDSSFATEDYAQYHTEVGKDLYERHDPEAAQAYFDAHGDGEPLQIVTTSTFPEMQQWAVILQDQLAEIGVESEVQTYDYPAMLAMLTEQPEAWDIATIFFNGAFASPSTMTAINFAFGSYQTPELQAVKDQFDASADEEEAAEAVEAIQGYIWDQLPFITISHDRLYASFTNELRGYEGFNLALWNAWLQR